MRVVAMSAAGVFFLIGLELFFYVMFSQKKSAFLEKE